MVRVKTDWDAAKADPVEFTKTFLRNEAGEPCIPHEGQIALMRGVKRNTSAVTGRQWGKSTTMGWLATWFGVTHSNRTIMVMAPTVDQARIIFNEIRSYFERAPLKSMVVGKIKNSPFPEIVLANGSKYMARGLNSPQYVRGNRVHLGIVDEASFVKEGVIRETVEPLFTVTGKEADSALVLISTPFGQGEFYELTHDWEGRSHKGNSRYAYFNYPSTSNPHADMEYLAEVKERYGEDSPIWLAEYCGIFVDGDLQVFPTADIKAAYERWPAGVKFPIPPSELHRYVQGVDLANRRDFFVSSILDVTNRDANMLVRMDRFRRRGYEHYKTVIYQNYTNYRRAKTILDATSLGESYLNEVINKGVVGAIGYTFGSNAAKHEVVQELARLLSEQRLILPFDRDIITELGHFQYKITDAKVLRMEAPRNEHDDIVMSLALAAHLACVPVSLGTFRSVNLDQKPVTANPYKGLFDGSDDEEMEIVPYGYPRF